MNNRIGLWVMLGISVVYLFLAAFMGIGQGFPALLWIMGLFAGVAMFKLLKQ